MTNGGGKHHQFAKAPQHHWPVVIMWSREGYLGTGIYILNHTVQLIPAENVLIQFDNSESENHNNPIKGHEPPVKKKILNSNPNRSKLTGIAAFLTKQMPDKSLVATSATVSHTKPNVMQSKNKQKVQTS